MSYINEISVGLSPYVARVSKAINFLIKNRNQVSDDENGGLFLALAEGPVNGWENETPALPQLNTIELENVYKFVRYSKMYFVKSDIDGKINVGNLTWTRVPYGANDEEYFRNARNMGARWLYVQFDITEDNDIPTEDKITREVGIYSELKLLNSVVDTERTVYTPDEIKKVTDPADKRYFDGILEFVQNREPYYSYTKRAIYSFVLEF